MRYAYARVSTIAQDLEVQIQSLQAEGCKVIYKEKFTGTKTDRPELKKLLEALQEGDTLVITKLDRFVRSAVEGIQTVKILFVRDIKVHILNMGLVENTPTGRLIFNILSSLAEFERDMIVERTQEGKALAKQRGDFREGRPRKHSKQQVLHALGLLKTHTYKEVEAMTGIKKRTLINRKNELEAKQL
ncbi:recombinase family protein [Rossellomorea sp. SC111]|uniref:recombinase family protein n=1 Tax=Rossellomorea sp. SC111 TaxID=2968985 RepID=UPI00215A537B|nr:recombinase family protein [Rossellomorea sp. SC111]MCR8847788.1 recombinase family protein [Rossellomorea sp. SC111]